MRQHRGISWRTFIFAVSFVFVISAVAGVFISVTSARKHRAELEKSNRFIAEKIGDTLRTNIEQIDRLAVGIGVSSDIKLFFSSTVPDKLIENYYIRVKNALTAYAFSMRDTTDGFMIYSWQDNKMFANDMSSPYYMKAYRDNLLNNAEWVDEIDPLSGDDRYRVTYLYRRKNNSYPYVMTMIRQIRIDNYEGVVAVDIDLSEMYSAIACDLSEDNSLWVLSEDGRVLITKNKTALFQQPSDFESLRFFDLSGQNKSCIVKDGVTTQAFSQIYLEDLGMYVVVTTDLGNIDRTLLRDNISVVAICLLATILVVFLIYIYTFYSSRPIRWLLEVVQNPHRELDTHPNEIDPSVREVADYILAQLQENSALSEELEKRMVSFRNTQLQALKTQINPHFLFNTLNNIMMLNDDPQTIQIITNLSDVLRYSLSDENLAFLQDEFEICKKYTQILDARYGGKFRYSFDIDNQLLTVKVPRLILQPLIENAVFHGLSSKEDGNCELTIQCYVARLATEYGIRNYACIDVTDNGIGMPSEKVEALMQSVFDEDISMKNIGVQNVARRLRLLYPTDSKFEIKSVEGVGTTVSLTFPVFETQCKIAPIK